MEFADAIRRIGADNSHTLADQLSLLLDATGYRAMLRDSKAETTEDRLENLAELLELAGSFHTARDLLDHAALATSRPGEDETARVRLMTLHKAKGLEFPQVFLPAWEAGAFPSDYSDRDEERRLAYVALTRGMRRITISYCGFRRGPRSPRPSSMTSPRPTACSAGCVTNTVSAVAVRRAWIGGIKLTNTAGSRNTGRLNTSTTTPSAPHPDPLEKTNEP